MDILDQMSKAQFAKPPKSQKTSIIGNISATTSKIFANDPKPVNKPLTIKQKTNQHVSNPHLRSANHFDMSGSFQKINQIQSHKDTFIRHDFHNDKQNKNHSFGIQPSLGVIASQQNSQESKNGSFAPLRRRNSLQPHSTVSQIKQTINTVQFHQFQQTKTKLKQQQQKIRQLKQKVEQLQVRLKQKQLKINELQHKLQKQYARNSQDRKQLMQEQIKLLQVQKQKLSKIYEEQLKKKQLSWEWQSQNKQKLLYQQIQSLKNINQKMKILLDSSNQLSLQKYKLQLKNQKDNNNKRVNLQKYEQIEREINRKNKLLQQKSTQFYDQRRQFDKQKNKMRKQLDQERLKLKNELIKIRNQLNRKQQTMQLKITDKNKQLQAKQRQLSLQLHKITAMRQLIQKQKEQNKKLNEKMMMENKLNIQKILEQKQRLYQLQSQLIKKINIVEMYSQKYPNGASMKYFNSTAADSNKFVHSPIQFNLDQQNRSHQTNLNEISKVSQANEEGDINRKKNKLLEHKKINVGDYLLKLQRTCSASKIGGRPIYKLQEFYM